MTQFNPLGESSTSRRTLAGERRVVTILFSDVKGSTAMAENLDPEDWAEIMNEAFGYLTEPIVRYGGTVARLMGDAILAFFGAPTAHEDDPLRAVLAGLDIVNGIQSFRESISSEFDLDFNVRVGINTGVVVVGEMGSSLAGEYTAMGDAVNLAARMEQTAKPGTVQITDETYRLVAPWIEVEELGEINAKGKSEQVTAYCVLSRKIQPTRARGIAGLASPLVGRDKEYSTLTSLFDDLVDGGGNILTIVGEAGIGKSRLIEDLRKHQLDHFSNNIQWIEARGISYEMSRPYGLFVQTLRQLCSVKMDDPPEIIRQKVSNSFNFLSLDQQSGITNTVELLLTVHNDPENIDKPLHGEAVKREIFDSVLNVWSSKALESPIVTVFDDLHWADSASVELINHIFQLAERSPILFINAFRPHRDSPAWQLRKSARTEFSQRYREINLTPLDEKNSVQLVDNLLAISEMPVDLQKSIWRKSEGNPFFLEEVVRTLIDRNVIQRDDSGFHWQDSASDDQIDIPDNLQALLLARIDRIESDSRRILQLASAIGRVFTFGILQQITDGKEDLEDQLNRLQNMDLIQETNRQPELKYTFRHELTRDAVYHSILRRQRRKYHRKIGQAIEKIYPEKLTEEAYLLAYHFNAARDFPNALKYYQIAGDHSLKLFANLEASEYYDQAVEIALKLNVPSVQLSRLYSLRGRAYELTNQYDKALDNYEELEALASTRNDRSLELAALVPQTTIYSTPTVKFDPQVGKELSRRVLTLAIDLRDYEAEAKALWSLMLVQPYLGGDLEQAITYGEQGLRVAREQDLREVKAYIQHDLARPYMRLGRLEEAWESYESSQNYWREVENLPMLADNLASLAESYYTAGEFDRALNFASEGLRISEEIGNVWGQAYNYFVISPILLERGEFDKCLDALNSTYELSKQANFAAGILASQMLKSWLFAMLGDVARAKQYQSTIQDFVKHYESFKPLSLVNKAQNEVYAGEPERALRIFEKIGIGYRQDSELIFHPYIYTLHVEIYLENGDFEKALETVNGYLDMLGSSKIKIMVPDMLNQKARALIGLNQINHAYEELEKARVLAVEQNCHRILWAILEDLADIEDDENKAAELLEEARKEVDFIGEKISDPDLLASFRSLPKVSRLQE
jgi:class 3 adenylate cyclase/tetratricopeptide (TPR) repeat protein